MNTQKKETYSVLAALYDTLMEDVDYETWADFIDEILQTHYPDPIDILEMACGTGALSLSLAELECYHLTATDKSEAMIRIAQEKAAIQEADVRFYVQDFREIAFEQSFDAIFSVFDSVNYLHSAADILQMMRKTHEVMRPGGLLVFDFSTPVNSLEAVDFLNNEEGHAGKYRYYRESKYDVHEQIHYNLFEIEELAGDGKTILNRFKESHKQRIYTLKEMLSIVEQSPYNLLAKYEGFDLVEADDNSARVTMVLQCRKQP